MYKFPLESLRKYRKRKVELYQRDLFECNQDLTQESEKLDHLNLKKNRATIRSRHFKIDVFNPSENILFEHYFMNLNQKIDQQNKRIKEKKIKKISATNKLLGAVKKRKMIEKLKEYRYGEYQKTKAKKLQIEADESAVLRFRKDEDGK